MDNKLYCEYCAAELTDDGRYPDLDCVYNVYIDAIAECDAEIEAEKEREAANE